MHVVFEAHAEQTAIGHEVGFGIDANQTIGCSSLAVAIRHCHAHTIFALEVVVEQTFPTGAKDEGHNDVFVELHLFVLLIQFCGHHAGLVDVVGFGG